MAGVKIGSGSLELSTSPTGSDNARDLTRSASIRPRPNRPGSHGRRTRCRSAPPCARSSCGPASNSRSMCRSSAAASRGRWRSNGWARCQRCDRTRTRDNCVSTTPFSGIPDGRIESYAEIRSVATMSRRSPSSNVSRTLPRLKSWQARDLDVIGQNPHALPLIPPRPAIRCRGQAARTSR